MIAFLGLSKRYGQQQVLSHVDLEIPDGMVFALLGPNGSGKSTLLKSFLGTIFPDAGSHISIKGKNILGTLAYKRDVSYMPQQPNFPPHLRVHELIALFEHLRRQSCPFQEELIRDLGIDQFWQKPISALSGGMIQKVNILQCFMCDSQTFVLDEPTLGLDPHVVFFLKQLIRQKRDQGKTVLFTSHIMAEVDELADRMALLVDGKIYTVTSPNEMKQQKQKATLEEALYEFWRDATT
ncbi:MAG: ABC transporter ATP-binding protein [Deltaproteobacteria bacterium]|nr:ABC transporter ATP-binding protein [Deltaproteobacteria bacterium]